MARNYAPIGAKPSIHGRRLFLTEHGRLSQGEGGADLGGVYPLLVQNSSAASSAVTGTASETTYSTGSCVIPANWLRAGSLIRFGWQGIVTAYNSTDTVLIKAYVNSTSVATGTATNGSANDMFFGETEVSIRTIGASGTFVACSAFSPVQAASLSAVSKYQGTASTAIDTTSAVTIAVKATNASNNAGNSSRLDMFWVMVS